MSGIFLNEDCNHFLWTRHHAGIKVTEKVLQDFISQYRGTQITDIAFNPNGAISFAPSEVKEAALDKFRRYKEEGKVEESNKYCQILCDLADQNLDMYDIWIDQCRTDGIAPWISIRMNDCHCNDLEDHILLTDFVTKNTHLHRVTHREYDGYFDRCLDYSRRDEQRIDLR